MDIGGSRCAREGALGGDGWEMTSWHTGLFSSLERRPSPEQRKQVCVCKDFRGGIQLVVSA
jgi:hypothetical protein